ncbi:MAG: hypothetical protein ABSE46_23585 [Terracidiphilus sp.]|jgi:hypothetical protein
MDALHKLWAAAAGAALAIGIVGCGTPGAPMPPSLNLPDTVNDLVAVRTGNEVLLTWKMPKKNTDKLLLKAVIPVRVCRKEGSGPCVPLPGNRSFAPEAAGSFKETLPQALAAGEPRSLSYFVELVNRNGRSAGLSNAAVVLAGEAPQPVANLSAKVIKAGVVLRWAPDHPGEAIRLHRKLLTPQPVSKPKAQQGPLAPAPEPVEQNLLVDAGPQAGAAPDRVLDQGIHFGEVYEYRAQRIARASVDGQTLELDGPFSEPVRVEATDIFPPNVPTSLAAVATLAQPGVETAIDLSWQPVSDTDIAGYAVYRREGDGQWQRISPAQPLVPPGFHDAHVESGRTYHYAVTAIDLGGHESARSAETEETVPNP